MSLKCHIEGSRIIAVWNRLRMFRNSKFYQFMFKCWILLKPMLGGVDGSLHLTVSFKNRLNQTEPATFSILPFGLSLGILILSVLKLCNVAYHHVLNLYTGGSNSIKHFNRIMPLFWLRIYSLRITWHPDMQLSTLVHHQALNMFTGALYQTFWQNYAPFSTQNLRLSVCTTSYIFKSQIFGFETLNTCSSTRPKPVHRRR
jgi:hypothetical protein